MGMPTEDVAVLEPKRNKVTGTATMGTEQSDGRAKKTKTKKRISSDSKTSKVSVTSAGTKLSSQKRTESVSSKKTSKKIENATVTKNTPTSRPHRHWTGDASVYSQVPTSNSIKDAIQSMMDGTWKHCWTNDRLARGGDATIHEFEVVHVFWNQNLKAWKNYVRHRTEVRKALRGPETTAQDPHVEFKAQTYDYQQQMRSAGYKEPLYTQDNEMFLFHGTPPVAAEAIAKHRFKESMGSGGLYGKGIYFAESSTKSDEYVGESYPDGKYEGLFTTLLCRVNLGRVQYVDTEFPSADNCRNSCRKGVYHGVLGDREKARGTFREFIVYDWRQCFPEFIVLYRRVEKGTRKGTNYLQGLKEYKEKAQQQATEPKVEYVPRPWPPPPDTEGYQPPQKKPPPAKKPPQPWCEPARKKGWNAENDWYENEWAASPHPWHEPAQKKQARKGDDAVSL